MESGKIFPQEIFDLITENVVYEEDKEYLALIDPNIRKSYIKEQRNEDYILDKIEEKYKLKVDRNRYDLISLVRIFDVLDSAFYAAFHKERIKSCPNIVVLFDILDIILFTIQGKEKILQYYYFFVEMILDCVVSMSKAHYYNIGLSRLIMEKLADDKFEYILNRFLRNMEKVQSEYTLIFPTTEKEILRLKEFIQEHTNKYEGSSFFRHPIENLQYFYQFLEKNRELARTFQWNIVNFYELRFKVPDVYKSLSRNTKFLSDLGVKRMSSDVPYKKIKTIESFSDLYLYLIFASIDKKTTRKPVKITEEAKVEIDEVLFNEETGNEIRRELVFLLFHTKPLPAITEVLTSIYSIPGIILDYIVEMLPERRPMKNLIKLLFGKFDKKAFIKVLKAMNIEDDERDAVISLIE